MLVKHINKCIKNNNTVIYGQNINAGSCLSGLTKGLSQNDSTIAINTPNSENTLVGIGFGLMMNGLNSVFFMKQLDFLLLGIDQIVNTYNILRQNPQNKSFTIFPVTVDSGYEGPQAALNNIDDFCSIAGIEGYSITNKLDADLIINKYLVKPGFRIISTGQRLLKEETLNLEILNADINLGYFQYTKGESSTIVCFNHSLEYGYNLVNELKTKNKTSSLFSINSHLKAL